MNCPRSLIIGSQYATRIVYDRYNLGLYRSGSAPYLRQGPSY